MNENIQLFYFFEKISVMREKISSSAKRSGLSEDSAILLSIIYCFPEISLPLDEVLFEQLKLKGLINGDTYYSVTGKGAILAKSFYEILKSV